MISMAFAGSAMLGVYLTPLDRSLSRQVGDTEVVYAGCGGAWTMLLSAGVRKPPGSTKQT